ncbi:hypothetical protein QQX98_007644 [Neonectria punicea]|uniref:Uncharacterized protein n=1 Tax=Neonectria punicea TaxID=979145 RepID=A0ABR1GXG0_9HYPO
MDRYPNDNNDDDWQPTRNIPRKPVGSPEVSSMSSPTTPQTPWMGHSTTYFTHSPSRSFDTSYPSPSSIWDPIQQTPPSTRTRPPNRKTESQTALLNPFLTNDFPPVRPPDTRPPDRPPPYRPRISDWFRNHWTPAWSMYAFLAAGIAFAVGHHAFYNRLHGKEADNQLRMLRYGTAIAFFAKASLVTAAILAYRQRVWMMVRRKLLTLGAVDSLFAAAEDLTALFHWEAFKGAKVAMCLAIYIWATPLVVILTSETLSVLPKTVRQHTMCPNVTTLNFTHEETNDFRLPKVTEAEGLYKLSVSSWNTTTNESFVNESDPNQFDYWTSSSAQFKEIIMRSQYLQQAVFRKNTSIDVCGNGWNCSYTIQFTGPGYKCKELASGVGDKVRKLGDASAPFNTSLMLPEGNQMYLAVADRGDYGVEQIGNTQIGGRPKQKPPYPKNMGAFRTEPLVWIGYVSTKLAPRDMPRNKDSDNFSADDFVPKIIGCEHYEMDYKVEMNYTNGLQSQRVHRSNPRKIIDTRFLEGVPQKDQRLKDNTTATPSSNYIFPKDVRKYRKTATYYSIGKQLRDLINGTIVLENKVANTRAVESRLINRKNYLPVKNFTVELEKFYEEMVLSLLSDPQFLAVSMARNASKLALMDGSDEHTMYPCVRERTTNCYFYHIEDLWIVYALAILMAIAGVVLGIGAMGHEYVMKDTRFSSIVAATRGQSLNRVHWEADPDIKKLKVGFGLVPDVAGESKYGFGLEGDVAQHRPENTTRSPVIQLMEWRERRASRLMDEMRPR